MKSLNSRYLAGIAIIVLVVLVCSSSIFASDSGTAKVKESDIAKKEAKQEVFSLEKLLSKDNKFGPSASKATFSHDGHYGCYLYRPYEERRHGSDIWILDTKDGTVERLTMASLFSKYQASARDVVEDRVSKAKEDGIGCDEDEKKDEGKAGDSSKALEEGKDANKKQDSGKVKEDTDNKELGKGEKADKKKVDKKVEKKVSEKKKQQEGYDLQKRQQQFRLKHKGQKQEVEKEGDKQDKLLEQKDIDKERNKKKEVKQVEKKLIQKDSRQEVKEKVEQEESLADKIQKIINEDKDTDSIVDGPSYADFDKHLLSVLLPILEEEYPGRKKKGSGKEKKKKSRKVKNRKKDIQKKIDKKVKDGKRKDRKKKDSVKDKKKLIEGKSKDINKDTLDMKGKDNDKEVSKEQKLFLKGQDYIRESDADDEESPRWGGISYYQWSPNSYKMLLISAGDVYLFDIEDRSLERLTYTKEQEQSVKWLPDGSGYLLKRGKSLYKVVFGSHQMEEIYTGSLSAEDYDISPDGKRIVLSAYKEISPSGGRKKEVGITSYRERFVSTKMFIGKYQMTSFQRVRFHYMYMI